MSSPKQMQQTKKSFVVDDPHAMQKIQVNPLWCILLKTFLARQSSALRASQVKLSEMVAQHVYSLMSASMQLNHSHAQRHDVQLRKIYNNMFCADHGIRM